MYSTGILFAIFPEGSTTVRTDELAPTHTNYTGTDSPNWTSGTLPTLTMTGGTGTTPPSATLQGIFTTANGTAGFDGDLNFDAAALAALEGGGGFNNQYHSYIVSAFLAGGQLTVVVDGAPEVWTIELRALRSSEYQLSQGAGGIGVLTPLGVAGSNFPVPAADNITDYSFEFANDAEPGLFTLSSVTATDTTIDLANTDVPPPPNAPGLVQLKISKAGINQPAIVPARIHVPTELVLSYDRSGSMNGTTGGTPTKWEAARGVANIISRLFANITSPLGSVSANNKIRLTQWTHPGSTTFSHEPDQAIQIWVNGDQAPQLTTPASAGGGTPIGDALEEAGQHFTASRWTRRIVVLLTDGKHNSGSLALNSTDIDPVFPSLSNPGSSDDNRIVLHTVQYATTGAGSFEPFLHDHLQDLTDMYPVSLNLNSSGDLDPLGSDNLLDMMSEIGASVSAADKQIAGATATVDPDVQRVVFLAKDAFSVTDPDATGHAAIAQSDAHWVVVDAPVPGSWTVTPPASGSVYVFFDHALLFRAGVHPAQLGEPIRLWADLRFHTLPISGADIRLGSRRPQESVGEVITAFVQSGGLRRAIERGYFSKDILSFLKSFLVGKGPKVTKDQDIPNLQEELLKAAEKDRNLALQFAGDTDVFKMVAPGRYELTIPADQQDTEYSRNFYIRADGTLPSGARYARDRRLTTQLNPEPSPENTTTSFVQAVVVNGQATWKATAFPKTVTKKPLGPGLGHFVFFQYADPKLQKELPPLKTIDNLDGTYSTSLVVNEGEKPPAIALVSTTYQHGAQNGFVPVEAKKHTQRVIVTLMAIRILDDKDCLLKGDGEFRFKVAISPNASPSRAVTTVLPERGHYKAGDGDLIKIGQTVYDGPVEEGAKLTLAITGEELDWPECFDNNDKLARYVRSIPIKTKHYEPSDEKNDPESLADWEVWYEVKVVD